MNTALFADRNLQSEQRRERESQYGGELLRILMRRKMIILAVVVAMTGAAALFAFFWPPTYRATSSVIIASSSDDPRLPAGASGLASLDDRVIDSQVELLGDRPLLRRVVEKLQLYNNREFGAPAGTDADASPTEAGIEKAVDVLRRKIVVRRVDRSAVITIVAQTHAPQLSADIANALAVEHIALQRRAFVASKQTAIARIVPRVEAARAQAIAADRAVATYRRQNNMLDAVGGSEIEGLSRLSGALTEAQAGRSSAMARADGGTPMVVGVASPLLGDLQRQAAEISKRIAEMSTIYAEGYPELAGARAQLQDITRRIDAEVARSNAALRAEAAIAQAREGQIAASMSRLRSQSLEKRAASVKLIDLERTATATNDQYVALLSEQKQLEVESGNAKVPARVLSRAIAPAVAHFPKKQETIMVAFAGSWLLGCLLALAVEQLRESRIRTSAQVERFLGLPTLGMLPAAPDTAEPSLHNALVDRPRSMFAESARSLYLNVCQRLPKRRSRVVLVTSPLSGEGKSTVSMCLGTAAMSLRTKAVVVDFDLRRPQSPPDGTQPADLADYLDGSATLDDILWWSPDMPNLARIGSRIPAVDPTGLLASPKLAKLFVELRKRFQFIVINTPPILAVRDAKTLSAMADGALLVVRWGATESDALRSAAHTFDAPFIGVVINRVDFKRHAEAAFGDAVQHHYECLGYYFEGTVAEAEQPRKVA